MKLSLKRIAPAAALAAMLAAAGVQAATPQAAATTAQPAASQAPADDDRGPPPPDHRGPWGHRFGGHGHMHRAGMHGSPLMHELRRLDLSDAQSDAVDAIRVKHHAEQRELFKRRRDLRRSFAKLDPTAKDYASQSGKLADQTGKVAHDEVVLRTKIAAELIATLTPEQVTQLKADRAERQARREQRRRAPPPDAAG
ncbi:MAG TPA: Spy/CpxP family protein refolding chaperone [Solimonas sp.]|nr:Spy/CpxP family protein refolding chaperone [Solimonas sp.]